MKFRVARAIHVAHPAAPEPFANAVMRDRRAWSGRDVRTHELRSRFPRRSIDHEWLGPLRQQGLHVVAQRCIVAAESCELGCSFTRTALDDAVVDACDLLPPLDFDRRWLTTAHLRTRGDDSTSASSRASIVGVSAITAHDVAAAEMN